MPVLRPCDGVNWIAAGAALVGVMAAATVGVHAAAYACRARSTNQEGSCPEERDERARGAKLGRLLLAETVATAWLAAAALRPGGASTATRGGTAGAALVLGPPWLPARCLSGLARRLGRDGLAVTVARAPVTPSRARLARIAAAGERVLRASGVTELDLVLYAGAARSACVLGGLLGPTTLRRVVVLGAEVECPAALRPAEVVVIRSPDDAWHRGTPAVGGGADVVEVSGIGRLSLLLAPSVADLVAEACAHPAPEEPGEAGA